MVKEVQAEHLADMQRRFLLVQARNITEHKDTVAGKVGCSYPQLDDVRRLAGPICTADFGIKVRCLRGFLCAY